MPRDTKFTSVAKQVEDETTAVISDIKITGYLQNSRKQCLLWIFTLITCGILRLVLHWRPYWLLLFTHDRSSLANASSILIRNQYGQYFVVPIKQCTRSGQPVSASRGLFKSIVRTKQNASRPSNASSHGRRLQSGKRRFDSANRDLSHATEEEVGAALNFKSEHKPADSHSNSIYCLTPAGTEENQKLSSECNGHGRNAEFEQSDSACTVAETSEQSNGHGRSNGVRHGEAVERGVIRYFVDRNVKYAFDNEAKCFKKVTGLGLDDAKSQSFHYKDDLTLNADALTGSLLLRKFNGIDVKSREMGLALYGHNVIEVKVTPIIKLLFSEILHPFYIFQVFACIYWYFDLYWIFASAILATSFISIMLTAYRTRKMQRNLQTMLDARYAVSVKVAVIDEHYDEATWRRLMEQGDDVTLPGSDSDGTSVCDGGRREGLFRLLSSDLLVPGDVIEVPAGGCVMQCDAVLIAGQCIVNESCLTGESVPVTKSAMARDAPDTFSVKAHSRHVLFGGTSVIQTRSCGARRVLAVVVRTGFMTAKGELIRSILFPKPVNFKLVRQSFMFLLVFGVVAFLGVVYTCLVMLLMHNSELLRIVFQICNAIVIAVPPSLPATMTAGILFAQARLKNRHIYCVAPNAINVSGAIDLVCFDKTGTLTQDGLDLFAFWPVANCNTMLPLPESDSTSTLPDFGTMLQPHDLPRLPCGSLLLEALATCHSLTKLNGSLCGDPLDVKQFEAVQWDLIEQQSLDSRAQSPNQPVCQFTVRRKLSPYFHQSALNSVRTCTADEAITLSIDDEQPTFVMNTLTQSGLNECHDQQALYEIDIIRQLHFSSELKRSGVVVRVRGDAACKLYVKGAPELVASLCDSRSVPASFNPLLAQYARKGYRVLAFAYRALPANQYTLDQVLKLGREALECQLQFIGLLVLENRLKAETRNVIRMLNDSCIRTVMVTGDNLLTALSVARDCDMVTAHDQIVTVSTAAESTERHDEPCQVASCVARYLTFHAENASQLTVSFPTESADGNESCSEGKHRAFAFNGYESVPNGVGATSQGRVRFALTGECWQLLNEVLRKCAALGLNDGQLQDPLERKDVALMQTVVRTLVANAVVCARMLPEQKQQLVERLQAQGNCVAMCGDGANDVGALQAANTGISLSEAEASIAAPFTSKQGTIECVPAVISEGRCALVSSFSLFKFVICYSLTQFVTVVILTYANLILNNWQYIYIDLALAMSVSISMGRMTAARSLSKRRPINNLVNCPMILGMIVQLLVIVAVQAAALWLLYQQPFFVQAQPDLEGSYSLSYDNTVLFSVSLFQYLILAFVCTGGKQHRAPVYTNPCFIVSVALLFIVNVLIFCQVPQILLDFFELKQLPSHHFKILLALLVLANLLMALIIEQHVFNNNRLHNAFRSLLAHCHGRAQRLLKTNSPQSSNCCSSPSSICARKKQSTEQTQQVTYNSIKLNDLNELSFQHI